jgi:hypothetical protein
LINSDWFEWDDDADDANYANYADYNSNNLIAAVSKNLAANSSKFTGNPLVFHEKDA